MTKFLLDQGSEEPSKRWRDSKVILFLIFALVFGGSTLAANFSINDGNNNTVEFGQGVFRVKACDGFISIALYPTAATYNGLSRVQSVELLGLNPVQCAGSVLRFQFYGSSGNRLPLYRGTVASTPESGTSTTRVDTATALIVYDTATAWNPSTTTYNNYASRALTIINEAGFNVGYYDDYLRLSYNRSTGGYKIFLVEPLCLMSDVYNITVESGPLPTS